MSILKRATGTSAKARRCVGWGGKGSAPSRYVPHRQKRGRCVTRWMGAVKIFANPHQGARERLRRRAGGMRYAEQRLFFDALPPSEAAA